MTEEARTPARILVVEDEAIVAMDLERRLARLGYETVGRAGTAPQAVERALAARPDLILMDVQLRAAAGGDDEPIDGIDAARRIRRALDVAVVFVTAFADEATLARAKATGPAGYVRKPFDDADLRVAIEVALHKHARHRELRRHRDDLRAVLDAQRTGAVLVDADRRCRYVSRAARRLLGWDADDVTGGGGAERPGDLFPAVAGDLAALEGLLRQPPGARERLEMTVFPDGRPARRLEIEVVDDPRPGDPGSGGGGAAHILFLYDVTETAELRRRLDERGFADADRTEPGSAAAREAAARDGILAVSEPMRDALRLARDVGRADVPVLLLGETGTGKELMARRLHRLSDRADGPFLAVNCGALSGELAASQLFGHRKGAFTGASSDRSGYFEDAAGGTLFLDEVGELDAGVQAALLRTLEEGTVTRLGETRPRTVDVRLVAATHRDLAGDIETGAFRRDLYYRVRVAEIVLPPLRRRPEDVPVLARRFLSDVAARTGKRIDGISDGALRALLAHPWPGNVRELKNVVEFAAIRARGTTLTESDLPPEVRAAAELPPAATTEREDSTHGEADRIRAALAETGGNRKRAAGLLGISRATFYRRLRQLGLGGDE